MLDYLSLGTMSLATGPARVVESVAAREAVTTGELAVEKVTRNADGRGNAFTQFFYDPRNFKREISPAYWARRGPAHGRSLHHWLFPQRATWVPEGVRNAGWNLVELPKLQGVFHRSLGWNQWMGYARRWKGFQPWAAAATENGLRVVLPAGAGGTAYGAYKAGTFMEKSLLEGRK
jgi:hypothetical protein